MSKINRQDTNGVKPLLATGELGYDNYPAGGDAGRVYVGTGTENVALAKKSEVAVVVETIEDFPANAETGDTVIVKDMNRGGTFIYDAAQSAVNNNGTIFNGWTRQYSGGINRKWFGLSVASSTTASGKVELVELSNGYLDITLPYGVVIGDSIAKGAIYLDSRLDDSTNVIKNEFRPEIKNKPGQISYELSKYTNVPIINQGIGGDTSAGVRSRWNRDVLNIDDGYVGPGTLTYPTLDFNNQKPFFVYLHVGTNDIAAISSATTILNLEFFAQSCFDNNIILIIATIGGTLLRTSESELIKVDEINSFIRDDLFYRFSNVHIADYNKWSTKGADASFSRNDGYKFADSIHPTPNGYKDYVKYLMKNNTAPIVQSGFRLDRTNSSINFSKINTFWFNGNTYSNIETGTQRLAFDSTTNTPSLGLSRLKYPYEPINRMVIKSSTVVAGTGSITGFTGITGTYTTYNTDNFINSEQDDIPMPLNLLKNGSFLDWATDTSPTNWLPQVGRGISFNKTSLSTSDRIGYEFKYACEFINTTGTPGYYAYYNSTVPLASIVSGKLITVVAYVKSASEICSFQIQNLTSAPRIPSNAGRFGTYYLHEPDSKWQKIIYYVDCRGCYPTDNMFLTLRGAASTGNGSSYVTGLAMYEGYIDDAYFTFNNSDL